MPTRAGPTSARSDVVVVRLRHGNAERVPFRLELAQTERRLHRAVPAATPGGLSTTSHWWNPNPEGTTAAPGAAATHVAG